MSNSGRFNQLASETDLEGVREGALPASEARFVLEFQEPPELKEAREAVAYFIGSDRFLLQYLFDADDEEMAEFLVLRFPGVERTLPSDEMFAMSYELEEALGLESCEPDLGTGFFADPEPPVAVLRPEIADLLDSSCWVDTPTPADKLWALKNLKVDKAWALNAGQGDGVLIAQPDTGVAAHPELEQEALRLDLARDILDGDVDPTDPLDPSTANPGHGSSTASVAASRADGDIVGSAPGAKLVPIRCIDDVKIFDGSPVAAAVNHARRKGCHIVTMSLGGIFSRSLRKATRRAIRDNMIVLAAAGNCVRFVVWPARYDHVIAVGGTNSDDKMWKGSSRGSDVDFAAPAELVWRAKHDIDNGGDAVVSGGQGTSFAVALTAGVAALWLSHHGRDALIAEAEGRGLKLQDLFRAATHQTARRPPEWDSGDLGAGIVDAEALLKLAPDEILTAGFEIAGEETLSNGVAKLVAEAAGAEFDAKAFDWDKYQAELSYLVLDDARFGRFTGLPEAEAMAGRFGASDRLREAVKDSAIEPLQGLVGRTPNPSAELGRLGGEVSVEILTKVLGQTEGQGLESAAELSVESARENLTAETIQKNMDSLESRFQRLDESQTGGDKATELRRDAMNDGERAMTKLREEGENARFTQRERVALEALVKLHGRPAFRIEDGTIDLEHPDLGQWEGDVVLLQDEIELFEKSVGRIDRGGIHMGTGFVVGDGLVMTNRHVVETLASPLPKKQNPKRWLLSNKGATINFAEEANDDSQKFAVKSVLFAGPDQIMGESISFNDLDMALLEVETTNAAGIDLPAALPVHQDAGAAEKSGRLFIIGYPARPRELPKDKEGKLRMDVVKRLRAMFGHSYSVKYLSPGIIEKPAGTVTSDSNNWVFAHDATSLGGNSGSCVLRISDGPPGVAGLHFAGDWLRANYAHSLRAIASSGAVPRDLLERTGL